MQNKIKCSSKYLNEGRLGPFLTAGAGLFSGVARARGLERLLGGGTTGGSGGSNTADKLLAAHEGNDEFTTSSNGSLLSRSDSICKKMAKDKTGRIFEGCKIVK